MVAITTKFHGPTNVKGSRISASTESGTRVIIDAPHDRRTEDAHLLAAVTLCRKMNWTGKLVRGGIKGGYVFTFAEDSETFDISQVNA